MERFLSHLSYMPKFRHFMGTFPLCSSIFPQRLTFSLSFHQFSSEKGITHNTHINLLNHKDWLSQPEVIRIFQNLRDPNAALPLFDQLCKRKDYKPSESLYATLINKLALAKNFDGIETLMERIKHERKCRISDSFFHDVIKIYGHSAGRINKAIQTLFEMPHYKCWPSIKTFNLVLNLLVSAKQLEIVPAVFLKATELGVEIDACCLNILIKGLCECGNVEAALKMLDEFPKQNCMPNVRTFSTIMHAMCGRGWVDEAFNLLERMEMVGVEADAIVFNTLISGLRKQGRFEEGIQLFGKMMLSGCSPNPGTYQETLYCLIDSRRFYEAKVFMERMMNKRINPSFESYKSVMQGFCGENLVVDVEWALKQMVGCGYVPKKGMWNQMTRCIVSENKNSISIQHVISDCVSGSDKPSRTKSI